MSNTIQTVNESLKAVNAIAKTIGTNRRILYIILITELVIIVLFGIIIYSSYQLSYSSSAGFSFKPSKYFELENRIQLLENTTIKIDQLPFEFQGKPDEALSKLKDAANTINEARQQKPDVYTSIAFLRRYIYQGNSYNILSNDDSKQQNKSIRLHLQILLNAIGVYSDKVDGDLQKTRDSIISYQNSKGANVVGKIGLVGRMTLDALESDVKQIN